MLYPETSFRFLPAQGLLDKTADGFRPGRKVRLIPTPTIELGKEFQAHSRLKLMRLGYTLRPSNIFLHCDNFRIDIHARMDTIRSSKTQETEQDR